MLVFSNPGEIDPRLITVMGTNVKLGTSPIGFFGTGLKYAIAGVLRLGGQITITSGERLFTFKTVQDTIRGKDFSFIVMSEGPDFLLTETSPTTLGFTTDLGRHWEPWMLARELWCNARDEGGEGEVQDSAQPEPRPGETGVWVDCPEVQLAWETRGESWWLEPDQGQVLASLPGVELYPGPAQGVFYRGLRVSLTDEPSLFSYNVTGQLGLTEDRTCGEYYLKCLIRDGLLRDLEDEDMVEELLTQCKGTWEEKLGWEFANTEPNQVWRDTIRRVGDRCQIGALRTEYGKKKPRDAKSALELAVPNFPSDAEIVRAVMRAYQEFLDEEGLVIVPRELTPAMAKTMNAGKWAQTIAAYQAELEEAE